MRHTLSAAVAGIVLLLSVSCASVPDVKDADAKMVEGCKFLGHVSGGSVLGGMIQGTARRHAEERARRDAAALGATHIVWSDVRSGYFEGASANGNAYRCGK